MNPAAGRCIEPPRAEAPGHQVDDSPGTNFIIEIMSALAWHAWPKGSGSAEHARKEQSGGSHAAVDRRNGAGEGSVCL